jgi:hypothetical protein
MIESPSCVIHSFRDSDGNQATARVDRCISGYGAQILLVNLDDKRGSYWLCRRADDPRNDYVLLIPSARWEQDARDAGFELVQKLNQR